MGMFSFIKIRFSLGREHLKLVIRILNCKNFHLHPDGWIIQRNTSLLGIRLKVLGKEKNIKENDFLMFAENIKENQICSKFLKTFYFFIFLSHYIIERDK